MAGESNLAVTVYDCTSEEAGAILDVLAGHGLCHAWDSREVSTADRGVILGHCYVAREKFVGDAEELAADLIAAADGAIFQTWTDPDGEGLGQLVIRVPALGDYAAECDGSGDPVYRSTSVIPAANRGYGALCGVLGIPWFEELTRRTAALPPAGEKPRVVLPPDPHPLAGLDDDEREDLAHELNAVLHRVPVPTP